MPFLPRFVDTQVLLGLAWLLGWVLTWRVPRLPREAPPTETDDEPLTVIIPARNEASSLPNLLGDLAAHRPAGCRVLVVDDHSEDDTAAIARSFDFVELLEASSVREGWVGKTWACHTGAQAVERGAIVFLDADVRVHGDALARAAAERRRRGGLLTIWPYHRVEKPYEHLSMIFGVASFAASGAGSLLPPKRPRAGFGPCMVTTKADYEAVGGHESVKASVIEDFRLSARYADHGLPVTNLGGRGDVSFRMYPDGLRTLLDGWTKNFGTGAAAIGFLRLAAIVTWLTFAFGTLFWGGGVDYHTMPRILYGLFALQLYVMQRQMGNFSVLCALLYPLQILLLLAVLLRSLWHTHVRRSVRWRGREVSTR